MTLRFDKQLAPQGAENLLAGLEIPDPRVNKLGNKYLFCFKFGINLTYNFSNTLFCLLFLFSHRLSFRQ